VEPTNPVSDNRRLPSKARPPIAGRSVDALRRLEDAVLAETGNRYEKVVALDAGGRVVLEKTGAADQVRLTQAELDALKDSADLITHNHPSGGGIGVAGFGIAVEVNARELHAFGHQYRYVLRRKGATWPDLDGALDVLAQLERETRRLLQARVAGGSLTPREATVGYWHEVWTGFARRCSEVHYVRETR
jgi:hypothetical protein